MRIISSPLFFLLALILTLSVGLAACDDTSSSTPDDLIDGIEDISQDQPPGDVGVEIEPDLVPTDLQDEDAEETSGDADEVTDPDLVDIPPTCGDGVRDPGETCDDGALNGSEGYCNLSCSGPTGVCGDGNLEGQEECDEGDGNSGGYGGCTAECLLDIRCGDGVLQVEHGEICDTGDNQGGYGGCRPDCTPDPYCGDALITHNENCDDGNASAGDGCSEQCQQEEGYLCREEGAPCDEDHCGDGILDEGEACDDGDRDAGDGCDETCSAVEYGFDCPVPGASCVARSCGDGVIAGQETCDDGNSLAGDGCSDRCQVELGWQCPQPGQPCIGTVCGDGSLDGIEECDDGDANPGDGCDDQCLLEEGYDCPTPGSDCVVEICGDGVIRGLEECDDGDSDSGDGCDASCHLEQGWWCPNEGADCELETCGDGTQRGAEECDDGNLMAGDGCDPLCRQEAIFDCVDGVCKPACGDGITLYPMEECDDGNLSSGDGCSAACTREVGYACTDYTNPTPSSIQVPIVYRDFRAYNETNGHPDFEQLCCGLAHGLVHDQLDADGKPVYASSYGDQGDFLINNADTFYQWYRDGSWCMTFVEELTLNQLVDDAYRFASGSFFPLTDRGYGNYYNNQNFHFTSELRAYFRYRGGEVLDFTGDDDVWVFINGRLAVDIGGVHGASNGSVTLSNSVDAGLGVMYDPRFDIYEEGIYEIALFQAERHTSESNYQLTLDGFLNTGQSFCDEVCGDGVRTRSEACDDGNTIAGDGCSIACEVEPGWNCEDDGTCTQPECGDGIVEFPEACDDGNTDAGDGCDAGCRLEGCGDGAVAGQEECDDANLDNSDACTTECRNAACGDHYLQAGEECDDGNVVDADSCTSICTLPYCGDGFVSLGESCDDGVNDGSYGSCTWDCQSQTSFCGDGVVDEIHGEVCDDGVNDGSYGGCAEDCLSLPSYCGDGVIDEAEGEFCDDGNDAYGDGCDGTCLVEVGWWCDGEPSECVPIN